MTLGDRGVGGAAANPARVHLLLSAGGVRCLSYIGALAQLEEAGYEVATVSTCSAGTFVGALYCCGVSPQAMRDAVLGLDLRRLAGDVRWRLARRLWTLRSWPYALYGRPGIPQVFSRILEEQGRPRDPLLGELQRPLSTAAVDVASRRLLVYSSDVNPHMRATELLRIAVAIPLMYPPHVREGKEVMDAALASLTPIWLATGQREELPIVVLRAPPPPASPGQRVVGWVNDVIYSATASRDTYLLERLPKVSVYDIVTRRSGYDFDLSRSQVEDLIEAGRRSVAEAEERRAEQVLQPSHLENDDDRAERKAAGLYGRHLDRLARGRAPTVFLSYAREDRRWVDQLRTHLGELLADTSVSVWDDSYIKPSALWDAAIEDAIERARVAVLFVSSAFRESDYIAGKELPPLREQAAAGRARILWVSVDGSRPDEREQALQAVGDPEQPLAAVSEADADRALAALARVIEIEYRGAVAGPENDQAGFSSLGVDSAPSWPH